MVRGSWRSWRSTRRAVASVTRASCEPRAISPGTRPRGRGSPVRAQHSCGVPVARIRPSRISRSASQRSASSITWLETSSVAPASASDRNVAHRSRRSTGSRPTVGSSRTSRSGRPISALARVAGQRAARAAGPPRSRRADRRPRPGAATRPVENVPLTRGRWRNRARVEPRDGRGQSVRRPPADARRPARRERRRRTSY